MDCERAHVRGKKNPRKSKSLDGLKAQVKTDLKFWHNPLFLHEERPKKSEWKLWLGQVIVIHLDVRLRSRCRVGFICDDTRLGKLHQFKSGWKWESKVHPPEFRNPHSSRHPRFTVNQQSFYPIWSASLHLPPPFLSLRSSILHLYLFDLAARAARLLCTTRLHAAGYSLFLCAVTFTHPGSGGENLRDMSKGRRKRRRFHDKRWT